MVAKPNLQGVWVITPLSPHAYNWLASTRVFVLEELNPSKKALKAVVTNFHQVMSTDLLLNLPNIKEAVRQRSKAGMDTQTVVCTFEGKIPKRVHIPIYGSFPVKPFHTEPLRCFRCQKYGHHKKQCTASNVCAVCSGRHATEVCLSALKESKTIQAKCPNCRMGHHAWNRRCPERLRRIQSQRPQAQAAPKREAAPTPAPRRQNPSTSAPVTAWRQPAATPKPQRPKPAPRRRITLEGNRVTKPQEAPLPPAKTGTVPKLRPRILENKKAPAPASIAPVATKTPAPSHTGFWDPTPTITLTEGSLKTLLQQFAATLSTMMGSQVDPQAVDATLDGLIAQARQSRPLPPPATITTTEPEAQLPQARENPSPHTPLSPITTSPCISTPTKRRTPQDIPLEMVDMEANVAPVPTMENFPPLLNHKDPRLQSLTKNPPPQED